MNADRVLDALATAAQPYTLSNGATVQGMSASAAMRAAGIAGRAAKSKAGREALLVELRAAGFMIVAGFNAAAGQGRGARAIVVII